MVRDQFISNQLIPSRSHSLELGRLTRFSYPWADSTYTSLVMVVPVLEKCFNCKISQSAPSEKQMSHSCCCTVEDSLSWVVSDRPARYCSKDERGGQNIDLAVFWIELLRCSQPLFCEQVCDR